MNDGTDSTSQSVQLVTVADPIFLISNLLCTVNYICVSSYSNTYEIALPLKSLVSNNTSVFFGSSIYLLPNSETVVYSQITATTYYGCSVSSVIVIRSYFEIFIPIPSVFCESSSGLSIVLTSSLSGVSVSGFNTSGSVVSSSACASSYFYTVLSSSTSVGFQAFATTPYTAPDSVTTPSNVINGNY